jgi:hypothetical protein
VLDEADRILEEQFMAQMKEIIKLCARNRQTLLFSATMTEEARASNLFIILSSVILLKIGGRFGQSFFE